jgi:hypothetical protein
MGASFYKVVGISMDDHEINVKELKEGDELSLIRHSGIGGDLNAIAIARTDGKEIGYISAHFNASLASEIDKGTKFSAHVFSIAGGNFVRHYSVYIKIEETNL